MKRIAYQIGKRIHGIVERFCGNGLAQAENIVTGQGTVTPGMPEILRECAGEGIVLLENDGVLPLKQSDRVAVFGRCQNDWFYVGYGSGGDVHPPYTVSLMEGLANCGVKVEMDLARRYADWCREHPADHGWWGHWPYFHPEMPLTEEIVRNAAENTDIALVVIGRAAGEDRENVLKAGSYYLTDQEHHMLRQVSQAFAKVVLLINSGNVMDLSFVKEYPISALAYVWQLGMESGNAVTDMLTGKIKPSGKLTAAIARNYADHPSADSFGNREFNNYEEDIYVGYRYFETFAPEKQLYPFGYGLSYTTFSIVPEDCFRRENGTDLRIRVKNTGDVPGREVVQIYCMAPGGKLSKAKKNLVAYRKTSLLAAGEMEELLIHVRDRDCASFDDDPQNCGFLLERGEYTLYAGSSAATDTVAGSFVIGEDRLLERCNPCISPEKSFSVLTVKGYQPARVVAGNLKERILKNLPEAIPQTGDRGIKLSDVAQGKNTMEDFIAQLSDAELADLTRGEGPMNSPLGTVGNAGAFGGITEALREKGILPIITADGPSGLRVKKHTSLLPCGNAIACTWNDELVERMFTHVGREVDSFGVDVMLAPGMNIQRNPLCGRNFEYFSEDPYLTGKIGAAAVRGLQKGGISACPKHFACNNQEVNRNQNDSRLSMRALREIYLRAFEICIKEARPQNIMTSYNKINGVWSHYSYELATMILREEWGYTGNVITDWWMQKASSPEFPHVRDNGYRVRAQVDVLMPGSESYMTQKRIPDRKILDSLDAPEGLTRGELQRTARNVLNFVLLRIKQKQKEGEVSS